MTTLDNDYPGHYAHPLVTWRSTLLGAVVGFVTAITLNIFGVGIGIAALGAGAGDSAAGAGIASAAWFAISNLIGLAVGGFFAARTTDNPDFHGGTMQGVAVWAVTTFATLFLVTSTISGAAGSVLKAAGTAASASSEAVADQTSPAEARSGAESAVDNASAALQRNEGAIREAADKAADVGASAALGIAASIFLGLLAAIFGAKLGSKHPKFDGRPTYVTGESRVRQTL